jgi:hypothetical protein
MDPGFSQLAVPWEREKTQSIAFGSKCLHPKSKMWWFYFVTNQM